MALDPKAWINLEKASIMLIEPNLTNMQILKQVFAGFGARKPLTCGTSAEAMEIVRTEEVNLMVVSDTLGDTDGYEFVRILRRSNTEQNAFTPVIIVSGHTKRRLIGAARDCGANFVVAKPLSPQTLLERILWVAKECRPFIDTGVYLGPDRRFKDDEGDATPRRRRSDSARPEPEPAGEPPAADDEPRNLRGAA